MAPNRISLSKSLSFHAQPDNWKEVLRLPKSTDASPQVEIFLVHDLRNKGKDLQDRLERYVSSICSSAASAAKVSCRLHSYRLDPESLQRNGGFDVEYAGFVENIHAVLAKATAPVTLSHLPPSRIIFVALELGIWMIKNLLYNESSESSPSDPTSLLGRLSGSIFMGPAEDLEHEHDYIKERLKRVLTLEKISQSGPPRRFSRVNQSFSELLLSDGQSAVAKTTWILPTPDLESSKPPLLYPEDAAVDGMNRSRSISLFGRLDPRTRHSVVRPVETEHELQEKIREFCRRLHALAAGQNPNEDFNPDDDLYIVRSKPLARSGKNSVSSSTFELYDAVASRNHQDSVIYDSNDTTSPHASDLASSWLQPPATSPARATSPPQRFAESPQPYLYPDSRSFPFRSSDLEPGMQDPRTPVTLENPHLDRLLSRTDSGSSPPLSPSSRSRRRQKSQSWKHEVTKLDSEENITKVANIMNAVNRRIADYYRAVRKTPHASDESDLYQRCLSSLRELGYLSALECRIRARAALLSFNDGAYNKAKETLDRIMGDAEGTKGLEEILPEILHHRSVARVRLGEYEAAYNDLRTLQHEDWFHRIDRILSSPAMIEQTMRNNPMAEVVVNTNRVVALLWGYFGRFEPANELIEKAAGQSVKFYAQTDMTTLEPGQFPIDGRVMKGEMDLTRARLKLLQGCGNDAHRFFEPALDRLESQLGRDHFLTLEAASLNAYILACISDDTAEATCVATYQTMKQVLGEHHPLSMEVLGTLADIFAARSRPYEALDTVYDLRSKARKALKNEHPQVMRYSFQVGEANLCIGNYAKARDELQRLCTTAQKNQEKQPHHDLGQHPDILRYKANLAMANCCLDKMEEVEGDVEACLRQQLDIFGPNARGEFDGGLEELLLALALDWRSHAIPPLHPDVLETIVICSTMVEKRDPGTGLQGELLDMVYKMRAKRHGGGHHLTLSTRLELAFNRLENGVKDVGEAEELASLFDEVARHCEDWLGTNHILTLRAKLGRLFTSANINSGPSVFRREASENMANQSDLMGRCHPMVLDSRWRLFVFELLVFGDDNAHNTGAQLLAALRLDEIRRERLMESLQLEEKVASIYGMQLCDYERSLPIFTDMLDYCLRTNEVGFDDELEAFCWEACDLVRESVAVAAQMLGDGQNVIDNRKNAILQAMNTFLNLADDLLRHIDNIQSCVEGLVLLCRHLQQVAYIEENDSPDRLSGKMRSAFEGWQQSQEPGPPGLGIHHDGLVIVGPKKGPAGKKKSKGKGKGERKSRTRLSDYDISRDWPEDYADDR